MPAHTFSHHSHHHFYCHRPSLPTPTTAWASSPLYLVTPLTLLPAPSRHHHRLATVTAIFGYDRNRDIVRKENGRLEERSRKAKRYRPSKKSKLDKGGAGREGKPMIGGTKGSRMDGLDTVNLEGRERHLGSLLHFSHQHTMNNTRQNAQFIDFDPTHKQTKGKEVFKES
ncbi:hypothetical protein OF83DRAFT_1085080 [Amylostereum chailletii]|nr:hypothetical protein OF83DRAFT_1085080 [Amylostereum chailletii]